MAAGGCRRDRPETRKGRVERDKAAARPRERVWGWEENGAWGLISCVGLKGKSEARLWAVPAV